MIHRFFFLTELGTSLDHLLTSCLVKSYAFSIDFYLVNVVSNARFTVSKSYL